ncbi:hypothetical protein BURCENBC7_AP2234 [Burkholderia cenocepacia BC7]|nr:hypothetical protein BURCENK562V_C4121 [Burkholderia cenocepacia K56-2Valvano]ERI25419.1 hypothetical protein BURCENBC7_AP2234 [Burkholderia cenocepacia BC7]
MDLRKLGSARRGPVRWSGQYRAIRAAAAFGRAGGSTMNASIMVRSSGAACRCVRPVSVP